jgi:hypothetical protein
LNNGSSHELFGLPLLPGSEHRDAQILSAQPTQVNLTGAL